MARRPNVLFIMSDQHNARCLGYAGHPDVRTPNLDHLAGRGVAFSHAFVQNPICSPSRVSYLSGQYCHNHGFYGLSAPQHPGPEGPQHLPSLFKHFKSHGYRTAVIGKTHTPRGWIEPFVDYLRDCRGFLAPDAYAAYLESQGLLADRDDEMLHEHAARYGSGKGLGLDSRVSRLPLEHSVESWCCEEALRFIAGCGEDPWLAWLSFPRPHQVWTPAEPFWSMYSEDGVHLPPSADDPMLDKPPHQVRTRREKGPEGDWYFEPRTYEAGRLRVLRGYLALISQIDNAIGRLLAFLKDRGLDGDTLVIYTSDHGDFAGEHGIIEKAPGVSYDAITRVPWIWAWPGRLEEGVVCSELVESVDLFPTASSLAGLPGLTSWDGLDLSPILRGERAPSREAVFTECPWSKTIRTKDWKLVYYPRPFFPELDHDMGELYHVSVDPWETTNLYFHPDHGGRVESLRRKLLDWLVTSQRVNTVLPSAFGTPSALRHFDDGRIPGPILAEMIRKGLRDYL